MTTSCFLCNVLLASPTVPFRRLFSVDEAPSEVLLETETFAVVSDVAPVVEGHCLVVSQQHARSVAELGDTCRRELEQLIDTVERILGQRYGRCCLFEHGSGTRYGDAACIEHAHVHIVPYDGDLRTISSYRESFVQIPGWQGLDAISDPVGYLFTRSSTHDYWLCLRPDVERQHWRRVIAAALDTDFQDWRLMGSTASGRADARQRIAGLRELFPQ